MINVIKINLYILTFAIVFSSCSKKTSVVRRHYNKGYYVESSNRSENSNRSVSLKGIKKPFHLQEIIKSEIFLNERDQKSNLDQDLVEITASNKTAAELKGERNRNTLKTKRNPHHLQAISFNSQIQDSNFNKALIKKNKVLVNSNREGGLSLFWIFIIVLLLLWALGLLFLTGPLINLLLVIALILFILWLLRIV